MSWIGDLERAFAANLYPLRVPIAIGIAVGFLALIIIARRRGWFAAARRHRLRTLALVLVLLAVGLPSAWYLGSPLFIRTSLVEPAPGEPTPTDHPMVDATEAPAPSVTTPSVGAPTAPPEATPAPPRTGMFTGADDFHFGRGKALLIESSPGRWVVRFEDFSVRNGPDLYVYLSPRAKGYSDDAVELGRLKATDGSFNTEVPPGTDVSRVRSVVIWCKQFSVQFAVAPLR